MIAHLQAQLDAAQFGVLYGVLLVRACAQDRLGERGFSTLEYAIGASVIIATIAAMITILTDATDELFDRLDADLDAIAP